MKPLAKTERDELAAAAGAIRRGVVRIVRRLRLERSDEALSLFKLSILGILYRKGPMTAGDLAIREQIRPQSLTRLLASLVRKNYVCRQPDKRDRRRLLITLTPAGKKALVADVHKKEAWLAGRMERTLSPDERKLLFRASRLLDRLAEED